MTFDIMTFDIMHELYVGVVPQVLGGHELGATHAIFLLESTEYQGHDQFLSHKCVSGKKCKVEISVICVIWCTHISLTSWAVNEK